MDGPALDSPVRPPPDPLTPLAAAVTAYRRRFARPVPVWALIGIFTGGRLLPAPIRLINFGP